MATVAPFERVVEASDGLAQERDAIKDCSSLWDVLALGLERYVESLARSALDSGRAAGDGCVSTILDMMANRGLGRFSILECDWGKGWLLVESKETLETRLGLAGDKSQPTPRCELTRQMLRAMWRSLRQSANLEAEVAVVEISCVLSGAPACRFAAGSVEELVSRGLSVQPPATGRFAEVFGAKLEPCRSIDNIKFGVFFLDLDGRFTFANKWFLELTGLSPSKLLGAHYSICIQPEDLPVVDAAFKRLAQGRPEPYPIECGILGQDGTSRLCIADAFPVYDAEGKTAGFQGFVADISERKSFDDRSRSFREVLYRSSQPFLELEPEGKIRNANEKLGEYLGLEASSVVGMHLTQLLSERHSSAAYKAFLEVASGRLPFSVGTWDVTTAGGVCRSTLFHFFADGPCEGKVLRVLATLRDRESEEKVRRELGAKLLQYEAVISAAKNDALIFETDSEGALRKIAGPVEEILGYTPEELIGIPFPPYVHADDLQRTLAALRNVSGRAGTASDRVKVESTTCRLRRKNGKWGTFRFTVAGMAGPSGATAIAGLLRDITESVERQERLTARDAAISGLLGSEDIWIVECDADGRVTALSKAFERYTGFDREECIGRPLASLVVPGSNEGLEICTKPPPQGGSYPRVQLEFIRRAAPSGEGCIVELEPAAVRSPAGDFLGVIAIGRDITEEARRRAIELERNELALEVATLRSEVSGRYGPDRIVGQDPKMRAICETILEVGRTNATVLIQGETGTGKELVAKAIHYNSPRRDKPFVKVDCGALAETLLESELFGHVKGAFTGAVRDRPGRFELAHEGTIFLDEIHNLSFALQAKLLRVVQEGRFERVGSTKTQEVDVRIVAATNEDLEELVERGRFRKDLYYRLNVIPIRIPPLRERLGDIPFLVSHFIRRFAEKHGRDVNGISKEAIDRLLMHDWPGNVRELENVIEQAVVLCRDKTIQLEDLRLPENGYQQLLPRARTRAGLPVHQDGLVASRKKVPHVRESVLPILDGPRTLKSALAEPERRLLVEALAKVGGNKKRAAELLGISRSALYEKLKRHGLLLRRSQSSR